MPKEYNYLELFYPATSTWQKISAAPEPAKILSPSSLTSNVGMFGPGQMPSLRPWIIWY